MTGVSELDGASAVREEDSFDVESVRTWLAEQGTQLADDVEVQQFGGGASNLTYSLRDGSHDLILRRPPAARRPRARTTWAASTASRTASPTSFPLVPEMVALCEDESVIGCEFYVMQRVDGIIPRRDFPPGVSLDEEQARTLCTNALDVLIDLHRIDVDATPLASMNKGEGYVERQISGWSKRFRNAHTEDIGDYETVMAWLDEHQPKDVASCLIHNDFRFDNLVLDRDDPTRPVGVLDWEMATVGDPLMDLGGTLAYWVQDDDDEFFRMFRRQPTNLPGMLSRAEVVDYYCERWATRSRPDAVAVLRGLRAVPPRRDRAADLLPLLPRPDHERGLRDLRPGRQPPRAALQPDHRGRRMRHGR